MNMYVKTVFTIVLCISCMTAIAADRFIVKYKLSESQKAFLASHAGADAKEARAKIRKELRERLSNEQIDALSKAAEVKEAVKIQATDWHSLGDGAHVIILSEDLSEAQTEKFINNVSQYNDIESIEEDKELKAFSALNPTYQWDMTGQKEFLTEPTWSGDNFNKAWTALESYGNFPGKNITVAVLDTGYTPHPNFIDNLQPLNGQAGVYGYKFISDCRMSGECPASTTDVDARNDPHSKYTPNGLDLGDFITAADTNYKIFRWKLARESSWHGSHVIGTITGNGYNINNSDYMTGGAYWTRVVPVRVLGKSSMMSDITDAMMWAAGFEVDNVDGSPVPINPNPAQIISMSLGGTGQCNIRFQNVINDLVREGVIIVVAAGNEKQNIKNVIPAGCNNVISVAAKEPTGRLAYYSNFGNTTITASGGDGRISNPLSMIKSTVWSSLKEYQTPENGGQGIWKEMEGTSMATSHVSAAVAILIGLLKAQNKTYTNKDIVELLQKSATEYTECNADGCTTGLALDVYNAVNNVLLPDCIKWFYSASKTVANIAVGAVIDGVTVYFLYRLMTYDREVVSAP